VNCVSSFICSWEYPGKQGIGCNTISPNDSANFLSFLQELRARPGGNKIILSATVNITPFVGVDGNPMMDVSAFAAVLDYIGELTSFNLLKNYILFSFFL
jgi:chitinase